MFPPFMVPEFGVPLDFIQAGGLQGSATTLMLGLMERACLTKGMR